ncbi:MAG: succinyldiaminopimelate transaminase [Candidatus Melainabacteria bacterium]|nr:MAG: succinyldiaminopimelate transaminase [Candidatus Melainabacteria bacterium]
MNPNLAKLQLYPFERLAELNRGATPPADKAAIVMSIGEPRHPAPQFIKDALVDHLDGLSRYPATQGSPELRAAIGQWLVQRFSLKQNNLDPERNILPVNGTREALFAIAQCVVDEIVNPLVLLPNPFYQIYEGAALLAGAQPWYINIDSLSRLPDFDRVPDDIWKKCQLLYLCSPGNPTGAVIDPATFSKLITLAQQHDFIIASDECYSEIYLDDKYRPASLLSIAEKLGLATYDRCLVFNSLSKRSSVPGLRSGFVAGDARLIDKFRLYRTYHGSAMSPPVQSASLRAWQDENHVKASRELYREKFRLVADILAPAARPTLPEGGFFLWLPTNGDDTRFARDLYQQYNLTVLPGTFLSRVAQGIDPGRGYVRIALVGSLAECEEAACRLRDFISAKVARP